MKSSAVRVQTVPSIHAQRQAHGRVVRSLPAGLDQTKPQTLYLIYPQPYGSGLSVDVKCGFWSSRFLFLGKLGDRKTWGENLGTDGTSPVFFLRGSRLSLYFVPIFSRVHGPDYRLVLVRIREPAHRCATTIGLPQASRFSKPGHHGQNVFLEMIRYAGPWCQQYRFPSVENRDGWGSQFRNGARDPVLDSDPSCARRHSSS